MTRKGSIGVNRPRLILGIDQRLLGLALIFAVIVVAGNDSFTTRIVAGALFLMLCLAGKIATSIDPNIYSIVRRRWRQKALYDPMKRSWFEIIFVKP